MKAVSQAMAGWEAYTQSRSPEMREQLLLQYLPLVRRIASRLLGPLPRSVRFDDLVSAGVVGLLNAMDHFDPTLGTKFETYAMNRIRGAMVDSLRELDWVPRSIRHKARQLEKAMSDLAQKLGRMPEDQELANRLDISMDEYLKMLDEINVTVLLSLDDTLSMHRADGMSLADVAADPATSTGEERLEDRELQEILVHHLRHLPEQEKLVLALYYYEELTFKEIGAVLNLTESRVSQIHSKAVLHLRAAVKRYTSR